MANYSEQMQSIYTAYEKDGQPLPASSKDIAAWAIKSGLWEPKPSDIIKQCAEDLSRALREEHKTYKDGKRYRTKHVVRIKKDGKQLYLWEDMRTASKSHMQKAISQRRRQIVGDCHQLAVDVDVYNDMNPDQDPLQLILDFTDDVEEMMESTAGYAEAS